MADIDPSLRLWSATASSNKPSGATPIGTGLDDNLRTIQAVIRQYLASPGSTIASAATVDLSTADGHTIPISGISTVTGYGTEASGIEYLLTATGSHVIKNSSALLLPGAADITTAAGDYWLVESKGSGNWVVPFFTKANGQALTSNNSAGTGISVLGTAINLDINKLTATTVPLSSYAVPVFSADTSTVLKSTIANLLKKPTSQIFTSGSGTYVTPAGVARIEVRMTGGGAGGSGGGGAGVTAGSAGGNTTFGALTANGGAGSASFTYNGGVGGTASGGDLNISGSSGGAGINVATAVGGGGGSNPLGFGGGNGGTGVPGAASGYGGGGGGGAALGTATSGGGGGGGGYLEKTIISPSAAYAYSVGALGAAGNAGSNGQAGSAGTAGVIIIKEFYA